MCTRAHAHNRSHAAARSRGTRPSPSSSRRVSGSSRRTPHSSPTARHTRSTRCATGARLICPSTCSRSGACICVHAEGFEGVLLRVQDAVHASKRRGSFQAWRARSSMLKHQRAHMEGPKGTVHVHGKAQGTMRALGRTLFPATPPSTHTHVHAHIHMCEHTRTHTVVRLWGFCAQVRERHGGHSAEHARGRAGAAPGGVPGGVRAHRQREHVLAVRVQDRASQQPPVGVQEDAVHAHGAVRCACAVVRCVCVRACACVCVCVILSHTLCAHRSQGSALLACDTNTQKPFR